MGGTYGAAASTSAAGPSTGTVPGYDKDGYKIKTTIPESAQNAPLLDADLLKTTYMKPIKQEDPKKHGGSSSSNNPNKIKYNTPGKRETVVRKGNGRVWEDATLLEWDPSKSYRAMRRLTSQSGTDCSLVMCPTMSASALWMRRSTGTRRIASARWCAIVSVRR